METKGISIIERKSNFIHEFKGTPEGVICPKFYVLSSSLGCPYDCSYCYLNQTLRYQGKVQYSNLDKMEKDVVKWMVKTKGPAVLNSGELSDSLAWGKYSVEIVHRLMKHFKAQSILGNKYLLLLTKSDNWYPDNNKFLIQSWSLNPFRIVKLYEYGTASITQRLNAIRAAKDADCRVRIRIDPIIPVDGWEKAYEELCDKVNEFAPERVTLGSLRFFKTLPRYAPKTDIWKYGVDNHDPDNRMRLPFKQRIEIYKWFIERLECKEVALCKETVGIWVGIWKVLFNKIPEKITCNCTP